VGEVTQTVRIMGGRERRTCAQRAMACWVSRRVSLSSITPGPRYLELRILVIF
jgi:hypothetical protein